MAASDLTVPSDLAASAWTPQKESPKTASFSAATQSGAASLASSLAAWRRPMTSSSCLSWYRSISLGLAKSNVLRHQ